MLSLLQPDLKLCDGLSRREWLRLGAACGISLPMLQSVASHGAVPAKGKNCIQLFLLGAPPQQETWDPKPDSPAEMRGDLKTIASATPGLIVGEYMPRTAKLTQKIAVLRAVVTNDNAHSSSGYYMSTGIPHAPTSVENVRPGAPNDWPSLGALVRRLASSANAMPSAITLPEQAANDGNITWPGQDGGFLGRLHDPWLLECDPLQAGFGIPGLSLPKEFAESRLNQRKMLLDRVDQALDRGELMDHRGRREQAFSLITSPAAKKAFDLEAEGPKVRDRYGRNRFGQSCLLARRLIESGVRLVRVNWVRVPNAPNNGHWDTHTKNSEAVKVLGPMLDQAYSALLEDLSERGLLDETLVMWNGEFGRTPRINPAGGRDHWGQVFSIALAGAGIRGGIVHGASDKHAAYPKDGRVLPQDVHATVLHCMGIDPHSEIHDAVGRPFPASRGEVIRSIL